MIAVGHTAVGVLVGATAVELLAPLPLPLPVEVVAVGAIGLASHYLMDLVPHGHYDFDQHGLTRRQKLIFGLDFVLPISILAWYLLVQFSVERNSWLIGAGVLGAQLPDLLMGLQSKNLLPNWDWLRHEAYFHSQTHWHNPTDAAKATNEGGRRLGLSDMWQVVVITLAIVHLLTLR